MAEGYGQYQYGIYPYKNVKPPEIIALDNSLVFQWRPDWTNGVYMSYSAATIISISASHVEQRRAIRTKLKHILSFDVADDEYLPKVENFIRKRHSDVVWVPLWTEYIKVTSDDLYGETTINVESTLNRFSLNNLCQYLAIVDRNYIQDPEVHKIEQVNETSIVVESIIDGLYTKYNALVYPAIPMYLDKNRMNDITDHYSTYALSWKEWF